MRSLAGVVIIGCLKREAFSGLVLAHALIVLSVKCMVKMDIALGTSISGFFRSSSSCLCCVFNKVYIQARWQPENIVCVCLCERDLSKFSVSSLSSSVGARTVPINCFATFMRKSL